MRWFIISTIFLANHLAWSQRNEINLEEFAERLFQVQDQDIDYEDID